MEGNSTAAWIVWEDDGIPVRKNTDRRSNTACMHVSEDSGLHAKTNRQRGGVIRAKLSKRVRTILGAAVVSFILFKVVYVFVDYRAPLATAARASCAVCVFTAAAVYWSNDNPRVLRMLVYCPRYALELRQAKACRHARAVH